jgi:hypothetical protein
MIKMMTTAQGLTARQEKNRHHLVTVLVCLVATLVLSLVYIFLPAVLPVGTVRLIVVLSAFPICLMFLIRTIIIEIGLRRSPNARQIERERAGRAFLQRHFGILFQEDVSLPTSRSP